MTPLSIQLLGSFQLRFQDHSIDTANWERVQALLGYLLLHRDNTQPRQQMAFLLWPDSGEAQALTNLRVLLHRLRKEFLAIEDFIAISRTHLSWRSTAAYTLDVAEFEAALASAASCTGTAALPYLQQATSIYGGDLLPALYDDWVLTERERLQHCYRSALIRAIDLLEAERRYAEAVEYTQRLVAIDPLSEGAHRRLISLHAANGDRAAALQAYHSLVTTLEHELGVAPSTETHQLYERLLRRDSQPPVATQQRLLVTTDLVGRQDAWQQLLGAWQQAPYSPPKMALIWGEAGIGKTRLAHELVDYARHQGHTVASTRSYEVEGSLAYAPVADWLRSPALRTGNERLDDLWQVEVARLLPEVLLARSDLPPPGPLRESWQQQRFYEALVQAVCICPQPLLLQIDDLQWTDPETLTWLHYLLRSPKLHLLVVGTVRIEDVDQRHPLNQWLQPLRRNGQLLDIELGPLRFEEAAVLAEQTVGKPLSPEVQAQLWQQSEGHPLFLVEMVRLQAEQAMPQDEFLSVDETGNSFHSAVSPIPTPIYAVIQGRLSRLSLPARRLASLAAVIGREFTYEVLQKASVETEDTLVQALDELWQRRMVREQGGAGYDFSHDAIRAVAYQEISPVLRRQLHRQVATALIQIYAGALDAIQAQLGIHYEQSGDTVRAYQAYLRASEVAFSSYAPRQAAANLAQVLRLAQTAEQKAAAYADLGRAYHMLDQHEEAIQAFQAGLALVGDTSVQRGRLFYAVADVYFSSYDAERSEPFIRQALAAAEAAEDWETVCQGLSLLGQYYSHQGRLNEEVQLIGQALAISRRSGNGWREGRTLADLAFLQSQQGEYSEAATSAQQALALLGETDDQAGVAFAWNMLGRAQGGRGQYGAAFAAFQRCETIAAAIEHRTFLAQIPNMRGWLHYELADYARALELDQEGTIRAQAWNKVAPEISARLNLCLDKLHLGEAATALAELSEIEPALQQQFGYHSWRWRLRHLHATGLCHLALAAPWRALALAEEGMALATRTGAKKYIALNHALAGGALAADGKKEPAIKALAQGIELADRIEYQPLRWQGRWQMAQVVRELGMPSSYLLAEAAQIVNTIASGLDDGHLRTAFLSAPQVRSLLTDAAASAP